MDCPDEEREIRSALSRLPGVEELTFHLFARQVEVRHDAPVEEVLSALSAIGMEGTPVDDSFREADLPESSSAPLRTFYASLALLAAGTAAILLLRGAAPGPPLAYLPKALLLSSVLAGGWPVAARGWREIRNRSLGMNALMTISISGAVVMGEHWEPAVVVTLFALANHLEARSLDRAREALASLFSSTPERAILRVGGEDRTVPAETVAPGDLLVVRPGERVPVDATVRTGRSEVNEAVLTGESSPVAKKEGDPLFAGTVNGGGLLLAVADRPLDDSSYARILRRVERAQSEKAPVQSFMERFAAFYTPALLLTAVAVALVPPLLGLGEFSDWVYRGLVLLVVACPCAIILAAPVAAVSALTRATRSGILIKGTKHLELLGTVTAMAFDKTGTLTRGRLALASVHARAPYDEDSLLSLVASVEAGSAHPVAEALRHEARRRGLSPAAAERIADTFEAREGRGVAALVEGKRVLVGNAAFLAEEGIEPALLAALAPEREGEGRLRTASYVAVDGRPAGIFVFADRPRPEAVGAMSSLRRLGIRRLAMLTGDNEAIARESAATLGLDEVHAGLLPEDKEGIVREMARSGRVAMVGDGVNDAPALAAATVGVAMGAASSPAALETADVALLNDDLSKLPEAVALGRRMVTVIRQNVAGSLGIKAAFVALALSGRATLWMAVAVDMGTSLFVIFNGLRLLKKGRGTS
jgi:Cd2+/Zn2+-exporting ATPase